MKTFILAICLSLIIFLSIQNYSYSCGPFFNEIIFTYPQNPELPLDAYSKGNLGIIISSYSRSYLFVAYRYISGISFNEDEQFTLQSLWDSRLNPSWQGEGAEWLEIWFSARRKVFHDGELPEVKAYATISDGFYSEYLNINQYAIDNASKTLEDRIKRFGADNPSILEWVKAQDMVFSNSMGSSFIPEPPKPNTDLLLVADRNYQIASANFYAGNFDVAERMFRNIANDKASPWSKIANYLVARTLIRKATLNSQPDAIVDFDNLSKAENELRAILENDSMSDLHISAQKLLDFVHFRINPNERLHQIAKKLLEKNLGEDIRIYLHDYLSLLDKVDPSRYADERWQAVFDKLNDLVGTFGEDDLTDWIFTFQSDTDYSLERAIQKWEEKHSLPWLIALLSKINGDHPMADDLLGEAKKIGKNSPAYTTISFHIIRLLTEKGEYDEAKQKLDLIISEKSQTMPLSSHNLFLAQRMKLADNLGEFVRYAIRNPVGISDGTQMRTSYNDEEKPENFKQRMMFDCDSVKVMNEKMPISVLKTIVESKYLPDNLRKEMAIAVWVKAILLDDEKTSTDIIPTLNELAPELKEYLDAFFSAESREAKKFSAVYTILKFPGMYPYIGSKLLRNTPMDKIDGYRDNWWGVFNQDEEDTSDRGYYFSRTMIVEPLWMLYPEGEVDFPSFLSNRQKDLANIEWIKFVKTDAAPNYLSAIVIDWAEKHPEDPRVSEALHLAVRSTRYGNTNDKSSSFSKRAFQILHKKYPDSEWAKKTKYWY